MSIEITAKSGKDRTIIDKGPRWLAEAMLRLALPGHFHP